MSDNVTEQQQIELLKKLWKEYGISLISGVIIALILGFGWKFYHQYKIRKAEQASLIYEHAILKIANNNDASSQINSLMKQFRGTPYADLSTLYLAKTNIAKHKSEQAKTALKWIINHSKVNAFSQIAKLRLARIYFSENKMQQTLKVLSDVNNDGFLSAIEEIRGDVYLQMHKIEKARNHYKLALRHMKNNSIMKPLVEMKINSLSNPDAS